MAKINVNTTEFKALYDSAWTALDNGHYDTAKTLDRLARKANAALVSARARDARKLQGADTRGIAWDEVPSVFEVHPARDQLGPDYPLKAINRSSGSDNKT